jgi:hypothetical protein
MSKSIILLLSIFSSIPSTSAVVGKTLYELNEINEDNAKFCEDVRMQCRSLVPKDLDSERRLTQQVVGLDDIALAGGVALISLLVTKYESAICDLFREDAWCPNDAKAKVVQKLLETSMETSPGNWVVCKAGMCSLNSNCDDAKVNHDHYYNNIWGGTNFRVWGWGYRQWCHVGKKGDGGWVNWGYGGRWTRCSWGISSDGRY